ncbi:conjugal transfer protein [Vibrio sinensis]|uniref:Conjugal transfer protein n=1 Tax=Vibrio sinensis TaxID=2302434 RepID=A0A3A6QDG2_9VIBR|nr:conjugal transfer protein [Vibrio sinensis]RJX65839.1 conjugal transfer protein [Vibrio sinensis]
MNKRALIAALLFATCSTPLLASGGLAPATDAINDFRVWFYGFLGTGSLAYIAYNCAMAMAEKQQWNDVMMSVGKTAGAGGSVVAADWAWRIFGS